MYGHIYEFVNGILFIFITNKKLVNIVHKVVVQIIVETKYTKNYLQVSKSPRQNNITTQLTMM